MLRLSPEDQSVFCSIDKDVFSPVDGYWGKQGATFVKLRRVKKNMFKDALACSFKHVSKN